MTSKVTIERETLKRLIAEAHHSGDSFADTEVIALAEEALAAQPVEPVAMLYDDGTWIAERTTAGRALNNRMLFAGSPKVGVYVAPPTQPADSNSAEFEGIKTAQADSITPPNNRRDDHGTPLHQARVPRYLRLLQPRNLRRRRAPIRRELRLPS